MGQQNLPSAGASPGQLCELQAELFHKLPGLCFRRSETDRAAVLCFRLDDKEVVLPLARIGREFGIGSGSPDAAMLRKISEGLEFVAALRLGDPLPAEVVTGDASWVPAKEFHQIAEAKLRMQLVDWLTPEHEKVEASGQTLLSLVEDPAIRAQVHAAIGQAAQEMGGITVDQVLERMQGLGVELAYVEHLRAGFLDRINLLHQRLGLLLQSLRVGAAGHDSAGQVLRLLGIARKQIQSRFDDLDAQTGEIIPALQNLEHQRRFIRDARDWLYRSYRGFEPFLDQLGKADDAHAEMLSFLAAFYQYLAPRFMPATEWLRQNRVEIKSQSQRMTW